MSAGALDSTTGPLDAPVSSTATREPLERIGLVALMLLAPAALVYLSFNAGGYFPTAPGFMAILFAQALLLRTVLAERPFEGFSRALGIPLAALALFAAWELASALWAHASARVLDSYDRTLLYVLALALFGSVRRTPARLRLLIGAVMAGVSAVCLAGLISRVLPHLWPTTSGFFVDRLNYPLTYWNADGMLAAMALILGLHMLADTGERRSVRVVTAALMPALAAMLLLTFSRGALATAVIGLLAYCLLTRAHTLAGALLSVVPPVAIALRATWDATLLASRNPASPQAVVQGRHLAVVVGACMLGAAVLRLATLRLDRRVAALGIVRAPPRRSVRAGVWVGGIVVVAAIALAAGAASFADREYTKFVHGNAGLRVAQTRDRLTDPANNGRISLWKAAVRIYDTQKLRGTGAGTYQQYYTRYRTNASYVTDAHSLYLQSLAELGPPGLALIVLVLAGILVGLAIRIRGPDRAVCAALLALALAWALHQSVDWDWQMPAVTLPVFVLAGLALARPLDDRPGIRGLPGGRTIVALCWLVLAIAPLLVSTSYARLQRSGQSLARGNCAAAKHQALSSLSLSAEPPQAYAIVGVCDLRQGFAEAAVSATAKAASYEPASWEDRYWLAVARAAAGLDPRPAMGRALRLNPREPLLQSAARQLSSGTPSSWERAAPALRQAALRSGKFSITSL